MTDKQWLESHNFNSSFTDQWYDVYEKWTKYSDIPGGPERICIVKVFVPLDASQMGYCAMLEAGAIKLSSKNVNSVEEAVSQVLSIFKELVESLMKAAETLGE